MNYLTFRSNALQSLSLVGNRKRKVIMSKDDIEKWVRSEYERHYGKRKEGKK